MTEFASAKDVSEHLLERTGAALMSGDFAAFSACFRLPQTVQSFDGQRVLENEADLQSVFDGVRAHYAERGVTVLHRTCVAAEFKDADTVHATHDTMVIARTQLAQQPFPVFSILRRCDGLWKITHSEYAIVGAPGHSRLFASQS